MKEVKSKQEYREFVTQFFEYKDLIEDNYKYLEELKELSSLEFDEIEDVLTEARNYEKTLDYSKFEVMVPIEKEELIAYLVERIDKQMSLVTKLNIAKDRAKHVKGDSKNVARIQQKIRRLSLIDPIDIHTLSRPFFIEKQYS